MIRGLYTSGWSMLANNKKMDVLSNNLANVNTTGYKKDTVVFESFPDMLTRRINDSQSFSNISGRIGSMQLGNDVGEIFTYYTQGNLVRTDNNSDLAIKDSDTAFFTIEVLDDQGNATEYYTRDGSFVVNANNQLITKDGHAVMGEEGPIYLNGGDFIVEADGTIIQGWDVIDRLLIREFADPSTLRKYGNNLVSRTAETVEQEFSGTIQQGFLEQSNVDIVREMIDMISVMRAYESNQKILQAQDETLEKAVNEVGAVR
jgi:flagellar basal-body rod protein FlgF